MARTPILKDISPFVQLLVLAMLMIGTFLIVMLFGIAGAMPFFGTGVIDLLATPAEDTTPEVVGLLKYFQVVNQVGLFILPAIFFVLLVKGPFSRFMRISDPPRSGMLVFSFLLLLAVMPGISELIEWNSNLTLPDSMSGLYGWFKGMEEEATRLTELFLRTESFSGLLVNLMIIAVVAAVGEEFIFRGIVLRVFLDWTRNIHLAVIISAFLFSALHFQFFGLIPRFVLGLVLGYLFVFSGSLWIPIFFHFINNAMAVLVGFLDSTGRIDMDIESFGATSNLWILIGSVSVSLFLLFYLGKRGQKENTILSPNNQDPFLS